MDLQQLKYFRKVVQTLHVSKAAEELHITQPSLSLSIKKLEDELGVELFERRNNRLSLTKYGKLLFEKTNMINTILHSITDEIEAMKAENKLTIMCAPDILTPAILNAITDVYSNVSIVPYDTFTRSSRSAIQDGSLDFYIAAPALKDNGIDSLPIIYDQGVALLPKNHPLANEIAIHIKDLINDNFCSLSTAVAPWLRLQRSCFNAGFIPNIVYQGFSLTSILPFISDGGCITLISSSSLRFFKLDNIVAIPIAEGEYWGSTIEICYKSNSTNANVAEDIAKIIREHY